MKISRYQLSDDKDNYYRFQIINAIVPRFNGNIFSLLVKLLRIRLHRVISSSKLFRAIVKMGEEVLSRHVPCRFRSCKLLLGSKLANFFRAINTAALVVEANHISVIQSVNAIFHLRFLSSFFFFSSSNLQSSRIEAFLRRIFSSRVDENLYNKMQRAPISSFPFCVLKLPRFAVAQ